MTPKRSRRFFVIGLIIVLLGSTILVFTAPLGVWLLGTAALSVAMGYGTVPLDEWWAARKERAR